MPVITPGRRLTDNKTEEVEDKPDLTRFKAQLEDAQSVAAWYYARNTMAYNAWHARWLGQTADGRKWSPGNDEFDTVWPWPGASDTRVRSSEKVVNELMTVAMFAVMNMKLQAKSTRPAATVRESQQFTQLLQWMMFTHMESTRPETMFALNWREGLGASALEIVWEQERRIDYVTLTVPMMMDYIMQGTQDPNQVDKFASLLSDPQHDDQMASVMQTISPIVTTAQARGMVKQLRQLRYVEVPVPYVFKSRPRWTALRLMVDLLFGAATCDIQDQRRVFRIERVTETVLIDRIETHGYDPDFVDKALDHKGDTSGSFYGDRSMIQPASYGMTNAWRGLDNDWEESIELVNCYSKVHDRGVPALYCTVFHSDVDIAAKHEPYNYDHGQYPYITLRREHHERPILSSRGVPEIVYTWENEIKKQRDGRTDMVDLALKPPLFAAYEDIKRLKEQFMPAALIPERRPGSARLMPVPQYNPGSVEIEKAIKTDIEEWFGMFGLTIDPALKQQRLQQHADAILEELKPGVRMTGQLIKQFLPEAAVAAVVGPLSRPFHVTREEIQGQHEMSATVDMREWDNDFLKQKMQYIVQLAPLDHNGVIDWTTVLKFAFEAIDPTIADMAIQNQEQATQKEMADENLRLDLIIGSGRDQPLPPPNSNFQLRLQTLQSGLQEALQNNPATQKRIQENPDVLKVIENRMQYFQRQLQQQQNAQIGRTQVTQTFTKNAPALAQPGSAPAGAY